MSQNEKPYPTSERDFFDEYIENETRNPFARIFCRVRRIVPTPCDGTCRSCRDERGAYLEVETLKIFHKVNGNAETGESLDHEGTPITLESARKMVLSRLGKIEGKKQASIEGARILSAEIDARMALIKKQLENPPPPTRDLLQ